MNCQHKNCNIKAIKNEQYCWHHIGLYYTQKIRNYDPDEEDCRLKKRRNN